MLKLNDIIKPELVRLSLAADCPSKRKSRIMALWESGILSPLEAERIIQEEGLSND